MGSPGTHKVLLTWLVVLTCSSTAVYAFASPRPSKATLVVQSKPTQMEEMVDPGRKARAMLEMGSMSAVGLAVVGAVLFDLALSDTSSEATAVESVTRNLFDAAFPQSATDVVASTLAEGVGGVIGAVATGIVTFLVDFRMRVLGVSGELGRTKNYSLTYAAEALANTDFFLTRAAILPILLSNGMSPLIATILSTVIAVVPYEIIKYQARYRQFRKTENEMLDNLLLQEIKRKQSDRVALPSLDSSSTAESGSLKQVIPGPEIDIPEIITDIIKWLEYNVLKTEYGGELNVMGMSLNSGLENAMFGFLAAFSSQLYLDALYQSTNLGPERQSEEARNRTLLDYLAIYSTRCFSTAALFGVYDAVKQPIGNIMTEFMSGALFGCLGSTEYSACVDNYYFWSSPLDELFPEFPLDGITAAMSSMAPTTL